MKGIEILNHRDQRPDI